MSDRTPKSGICYTFWLQDGFIDIRRARIITSKESEQKGSNRYIYTLKRYSIDYYEMYKNSLYFDELIDPSFTRRESEIFDTFEDAVIGTLDIMSHHTQRMIGILTRQEYKE